MRGRAPKPEGRGRTRPCRKVRGPGTRGEASGGRGRGGGAVAGPGARPAAVRPRRAPLPQVPEFRGLFVLVVVTLAAGKLFTVFYIFTGIGLIVGFLNAVARTAVEQREEKRGLLDRRTGSPKDE